MDETTKQVLNDFVQQVLAAAQTGAAWTAEQTPLLVQEWLWWQMAEAALWAMFQIAVVIGFAWSADRVARLLLVLDGAGSDTPENARVFNGITSVVRVVAVVIMIFCMGFVIVDNILTVVKVWVAPRVVVLEKFAELVK